MQVEHHDLHHEFPEYLDFIHALQASSEQFGHLYDQYQNLTREVERLEEEDLPVDDFTIEDLKKKNPASIEICSLLVKPGNLKVDLDINYAVMEIPNDFIVGYGLDYDQEGRNLRDIYTIVEE